MGTETVQQQPPMATPQGEHKWLEKLLGEWAYESEAQEPSGAEHKSRGTESVRSMGGLWVVAEGEGEMPGGAQGTSIMTLGYDPQKKRFVGTWIGSMMTHLWIYDGELDAAKRTLTLDCVGPAMSGEGIGNYRDVIEFDGEGNRTQHSYAQGDDGSWQHFMTSHYKRK